MKAKELASAMKAPYYQDEACTIYHGDCRDILPQLAPVDLVLTDPPYGIGEAAGANKTRGHLAVARDYGNEAWDNKTIDRDLLLLALGAGNSCIVFGGNYYSDILTKNTCWLVWDKDNTGDFADCELAWTNLSGAVRLIRYRWNGMLRQIPEERFHPTQKPLAVMRWCISKADEKQKGIHETILDPFMGSGTTLAAAKIMNRKAIGIEKEEKYCEIAVKRLAQKTLFSVGLTE